MTIIALAKVPMISPRLQPADSVIRCVALALLVALLPNLVEARVARDRNEVRAFRNNNPCPATGLTRSACPGFAVDHIDPLCAGGADKSENMQWISNDDHRFKTYVDVRECRKLRRMADTPPR